MMDCYLGCYLTATTSHHHGFLLFFRKRRRSSKAMVVHSHSFLLLRNLLLSNLWLSSFPFKKEEKKVELIQRSRGNFEEEVNMKE
jgi:hypothetical protein